MIDFDYAERIADSITRAPEKAEALVGLARAAGVTDPDRAEIVARSIADEDERASALFDLAQAAAAIIRTGRYS